MHANWTPEIYRQCRIENNLSQAELAEMLGVTTETIHQRETGKTRLKQEAILAMMFIGFAEEYAELLEAELDRQGPSKRLEAWKKITAEAAALMARE